MHNSRVSHELVTRRIHWPRTRSARSSSASFPVLSTLTRAPKILILSVSMAEHRTAGQNELFGILRRRELTCVCNQDFGLLHTMRAVDADLLVENETLVEVRVGQLAALLFNDLDMVEVGRALVVTPRSARVDGLLRRTRLTFSRKTALTASSAK